MHPSNLSSLTLAITLALTLGLTGCGGSEDSTDVADAISSTDTSTDTGIDTGTEDLGSGILHTAYYEFDDNNVNVVLSGTKVVIETNGMPNHTSPYWSASNELHVEPKVNAKV
ncbi:YHYH protein, partial [Shewanella sp. SR41-2]|nr:YHYH protein [Shewanella sp. SR41-2]